MIDNGEWILRKELKQIWLKCTIQEKITTFTILVFLIITMSIVFDAILTKVSLIDLKDILEENVEAVELAEALEDEINIFADYVKSSDVKNQMLLRVAIEKTDAVIQELLLDSNQSDEIQYSKVWALVNCYEVYQEKRDAVVGMKKGTAEYIQELYKVYEMQDYLKQYSKSLMEYALEKGSNTYLKEIPVLIIVPVSIVALHLILLWGMMKMAGVMKRTLVYPIMQMAKTAKKVAANDFFAEDVVVENKDEIGELVFVFNKMKYATGRYIQALEEKRNAQELLHKQEMEKLEVEKRLETTKLQLLKSQINPHFLFNTLNVIGGMANLEEAQTTEKMINALSALFRYNLKTNEVQVPLAMELKVIEDYMYIQQMRFGSRISYDIDCRVDKDKVMVPVFTFQPLVENAIIHGLCKKEEGGKIRIRIWQSDEYIKIVIMDQGVGIEKECLEEIKNAFNGGDSDYNGIGVSNVFKRITSMYAESKVDIYSKKDIGTIIKIRIKQELGENDVSNINS